MQEKLPLTPIVCRNKRPVLHAMFIQFTGVSKKMSRFIIWGCLSTGRETKYVLNSQKKYIAHEETLR